MQSLNEIPIETQLLICCGRIVVTQEIADKIKYLVTRDLDWQKLLKVAGQHKLIPLLYLNITAYAHDHVPIDFYRALQKFFHTTVKINLILTAELIQILNLLKAAGIIAIPFKGPILAKLAYDDITLRQFGDLDIFVPREQIIPTVMILQANNYHGLENIGHLSPKKLTALMNISRHISYTKNRIKLEIHWKIEYTEFMFDQLQAYNLLYANLCNIDFDGYSVTSFAIENLILLLILHATNHRWESLSLLCEIAALCQKYPNINWQEIITKAKTLHLKKILGVTFYLLHDIFDFTLPNEIQNLIATTPDVKKFSQYIENKIIFAESPIGYIRNRLLFEIRSKDSIWKGIKGVLYHISNPSGREFAIALPQQLSFLYFILRPMLLIAEVFKVIFCRKRANKMA